MQPILSNELLKRWKEEFAKRKEPVDSDIEKRRKTASNPPDDAGMNPTPKAGKPQKIDSMDDVPEGGVNRQQWLLGYTLELVMDEHTGYAKWPLSFKKIEKDVKRPNKGGKLGAHPENQKPEQPPTCA